MSLAALVDEKETSYGMQPIAFNYTTFTEQVAAAYNYQQDNLNFSSEKQVYDEEIAKRNKLFTDIHGTNGLNLSGIDPQKAMAESMDSIIKKGRAEGKAQYNDIPTTEEVNNLALNRSRDSKTMYDEVIAKAAPDSYVGTASFIGQAGAWFTDPIHLATLGAGGIASAGRGILGAMAREAALNAGLEVPLQAAVYEYQKKLGQDYSIGDVASSVAFAGVMGAGFVGGIHIAGMAATKAGSFSGFTPEQLSFLDFFAKREAIETPPVKHVDSAVEAAHAENVAKALDSFSTRTPVKDFNEMSTVPRFQSKEVNAEHVAVLREFEQSGEKSLNAFVEKKFMDTITDDLKKDLSLARGDVEQLTKDVAVLAESRLALKKQIEVAKKEIPWESDPLKAANTQAAIDTMQQAHDVLLKKEYATENLIGTTKKSIEAEAKLAEIADGKIPADVESQLKTFKKNIKAAKAGKAMEPTIKQADVHSAAAMEPAPLLTRADVEERIAFATSPEFQKMVDKDFMDVIMDDPNIKMQNPETGEIVTAKSLAAEIERDEKYLNSIKSCMVGSAKK